jgi:hypothetical protein
LEDRWLLTAYIVTSTADTNTFGTLRYGINRVNLGLYNVIDFRIGTSGSAQTINLTSALPAITKAVFINGQSQENFLNTKPLITLNGASAGTNADGLLLDASNCSVSGLIIEGFSNNGIEVNASTNTIGGTTAGAGNVLSGNSGSGVAIDSGVTGVVVQGNSIGTNAAGTSALSNGYGVQVFGFNNTIGGSVAGARNVISGNVNDGVIIFTSASGNLVQGNYIGTDVNGASGVANALGMLVAGNYNTIGGTTAAARNVISGNAESGIDISGPNPFPQIGDTLVQGNYIGTNAAGTSVLANGFCGVEIDSSNNTIGGTTAGAGNLISSNQVDGILLSIYYSGTLVQGNSIGTNAAGTSALGNGYFGVEADGFNNTIGGTTAAARNVISGNSAGGGVILTSAAHSNLVQGNLIGLSPFGTTAVGNKNGIEVDGTSNTIGGTTSAARNVISGNSADGLLVGASGVTVEGNYIGTNATGTSALGNSNGVEIAASNATLGGTVLGARNVISGNSNDGVLLDVSGVAMQGDFIGLNAGGSGAVSNRIGIEDHSPGSNTIGGTTLYNSARNYISGNSADGVLIDSGASGDQVLGNFIGLGSSGFAAVGNGTGIAVNAANNTLGGTVAAARNVISGSSGDGVRINASGVTVQGNYIGTNSTGTAALANQNGVEVTASNNTIGGSVAGARNVISGNSKDGVLIDSGVSGVQVQGNYIGTDATGTSALGSETSGVEVAGSNNTIGGTVAGARNIISGNFHIISGNYSGDGVLIDSGVSGVQVQGNYIGLNTAGTSYVLPTYTSSNWVGIEVEGSNNTIGGTTAGARNVISGNYYNFDIDIGISGVLVQGNYIGTNALGTSAVISNGDNGVEIFGNNNTIGGTTSAARNVISGNWIGLDIHDGVSGEVVEGNYIGTNAAGTSALGNLFEGIEVRGSYTTIGGTTAGAGNVIAGTGGFTAGTAGYGLAILNGAWATTIQGNSIGTNAVGTSAIGNVTGVLLDEFGTVLGGTVAGAGNVISGNSNDGVLIGTSISGVAVEGNFIGTNAAGTSAVPNKNGIEDAGFDNTLGGTTASARNDISGNSTDGVLLDSTANTNQVEGNFLGTDTSGKVKLGNSTGIEVAGTNNTIGGTTSGSRNVLSGNISDGVLLDRSASGNQVLGNYLGTDLTGAAALANSNGLDVYGSNNTIGGTMSASRNVISGNGYAGVRIDTSGTTVEGNYIGTNAAATSALANQNGVGVFASNNTIGGTTPGTRNLISGNSNIGLVISLASEVLVQGNYVGTNVSGSSALGNSTGVEIEGYGSNNTIGGTAAGARNVISGNGGGGVAFTSSASDNFVQGNFIGINAAGTAALANAFGVEVNGSGETIGGITAAARNVISGNSNDGILIDSFSGGDAVQGNYIGIDLTGTSALGNGTGIEISGSANTIGGTMSGARNVISGNSTDGVSIDSSASGVAVQGNYVGTNNSGNSTLGNGTNGIEVGGSNNTIGGTVAAARNVISGNGFVISGNGRDGVRIDGGASGVTVEDNYIGTNAAGTSALGNGNYGVEDDGPNNTIGGTKAGARNLISGNSYDVLIVGASTLVQGNYLGTDDTGNSALNNIAGVTVASSNDTIGGTTAAARNVISGNSIVGLQIDPGVSGVLVQGNYIGTNAAGTSAVTNDQAGVVIFGATNNTIGGTVTGARNVISGNAAGGVAITSETSGGVLLYSSSGNLVQGNFIGSNAAGTGAVANGYYGVSIDGSNNTIGGSVNGAGNLIMDNSQGGIYVIGGSGDTLSRNVLYANGSSQSGPGFVLNAGANNNLTAPVLSTAAYNSTTQTLTVTGTFTAPTANVSYMLEFFANPTGDPEGKVYLGQKTVTPASSGTQSFIFTVTSAMPGTYPLISATLTDASGDTSAFSNGVIS